MTLDLLDRIDAARGSIDELAEELGRIDENEALALRLALVHCVRALRYTKDADGLRGERRQQATSAYRMGCAALGMEHG